MKRFIIYPGYIYSADKKERTRIGFQTLVRLYGLDIDECVSSDDIGAIEPSQIPSMFHLKPTFMADLEIPAEAKS